jgi:hypothetical protein
MIQARYHTILLSKPINFFLDFTVTPAPFKITNALTRTFFFIIFIFKSQISNK